MKSNSYSASSNLTIPLSRHPHPSVPISVYREIVEQLQATQAQLSAMKTNNQHLIYRNQQLQQEVERLMKSAYKVQQLANYEIVDPQTEKVTRKQVNQNNKSQVRLPSPTQQSRNNHQALHSNQAAKVKPIWQAKSLHSSPKKRQIVTVKYAPQHPSRQQKSSQEMNGWFLAIAIIIIILTAFTSGFLLVRPLLNNNSINNN